MKITVVVPTLNEERDLPRTLKSLKFADEVLIVDSGSTDKTLELAKKYGCTIIFHPFKNFAETRNFADKKAKNDWILSIDADVVVPTNLQQEIIELPDKVAAYKISRINRIWGKEILHTDWGPKDDNHIRLYHRSLGSWRSAVHEEFITKSKSKQLRNYLLHYNYTSVSEFITKLNSYSDIEAQKRHSQGQRFSYLRFFFEPLKDFFKRYFYKLGFLDGAHGFYLSLLQSIYYLAVNVKLKTR